MHFGRGFLEATYYGVSGRIRMNGIIVCKQWLRAMIASESGYQNWSLISSGYFQFQLKNFIYDSLWG